MSLDELLASAREHRPERDRTRFTVLDGVKIGVGSAVLGFAAHQVLLIYGHRSSYLLIFPVVAALWLARRITLATHGGRRPQVGEWPATGPRGRKASGAQPPDAMAAPGQGPGHGRPCNGIRRWVDQLSHVEGDRTSFQRLVQPAMVALIDERLRLRHGVSRQSDPQRARELLSDQLWTFVNEPVTRVPKPAKLLALVERIERV